MPNTYFQFKQLKIEQSNCAMKVGTDGVLLGAWANTDQPRQVLDIGTGTGLIALMLAQRFEKANIIALEIDTAAANEASNNFEKSSWNNRLTCINTKLQDYAVSQKFDLIVSNPPYFINSEKNPNLQKQTARHTDSLSYSELIEKASFLLSDTGSFCVVLPYSSKNDFLEICKSNNLHLNKELKVKTTPTKDFKRVLLSFSKTSSVILRHSKCETEELIIEEFGRHQYSNAYIELTKEFYLKF